MPQPLILLVEDDASTLTFHKKILESQGFRVDSASNGTEAGFKLNRTNYDLIVSDIQMPYTDGITLVNNIRKGMGNNSIPIVIVSGVLSKRYILELAKRNIAKIFSKPIKPHEFATYINGLMSNTGDPSKLNGIVPPQAKTEAEPIEESEEFEIN